jgi:hypothetical protein
MASSKTRTPRLVGALALAMGVAIAFGGCSSGSTSSNPSANDNPQATPSNPADADGTPAGGSDAGVIGAADKLSSIQSFKFTMTMKGGSFGSLLGSKPVTGTIVESPDKAAYMSVPGMKMEVIECGGKSYVKYLGSWVESKDSSSTSMVDNLSPEKMFGSYLGSDVAGGYKLVGNEQKNGVAAAHFSGDASLMAEYGSMLGVTGGTWTADVWIASDGGYPISMKLAGTGGSSDFLFTMDVTNVNDPANVVVAPI